MIHLLIVLAALAMHPAQAHTCRALSDSTTLAEIRECMGWRPAPAVEPAPAPAPVPTPAPPRPQTPVSGCTAATASQLRTCIASSDQVTITADIQVTGCPAVIDVAGHSGLTIDGRGHKILRTGGHRQCSLVDIRDSQVVTITDLTLDDDSRVPACVVADNCPRMVHIRNAVDVELQRVHVRNGKGYVIYTSGVRGFSFQDGSLRNSGVLGMYIGHGDNRTTGVVISGNEVTDNSTNSLALLGASDVRITGNTFSRGHNRGQWPVAPQYGTGFTGGGQVYIARASDVVITGNTISDGACSSCKGGIHGIELSEPGKSGSVRNITITDNTIRNHSGTGIYQNQGSSLAGSVRISGNAYSGNQRGNSNVQGAQ